MIQYSQINNGNTSHNKIKDKNHMTILIDAEKAFDKIQHTFLIKTPSKVGIKGAFLNITKALYEKPTANVILKKLKVFPLRSKTRQECLLSPLLLNIVLEVLAKLSDKKKKSKASKLERKK